jgi:ATP-dependent RNA helicase SUPV3L1/SUV3
MTKVEPMTVDDAPEPERLQQCPDFSSLQGLQVVGDGPWARDDSDGSPFLEALTLELEARAQRFHQAVDASIVLANDGIVRWLGDPIAKLAPGPDLLTPGALILADSRLPEGARQTVATRVELWLTALTHRLLGPLFSLRELQEGSDSVRDLAAKVANALGVLERDSVRNQVKAFDQNSRAALRKHGVRFGAYYIYVPTVLKPACRALALQLWGLRAQAVGADGLAQSLAPMASSGRTSLPIDQQMSRDGYRVAGFRPCGDRVVRVDIVERLADMIRAAFIQPAPASGPRAPIGFVVNGQMTSLTGCSGEAFSSILRSLGFESAVIKRSELPAPPAAAPAPAEPSKPEAPPSETETRGDPPADLSSVPPREDESHQAASTRAAEETEGDPEAQGLQPPSGSESEPASAAADAHEGATALGSTAVSPAEDESPRAAPTRAAEETEGVPDAQDLQPPPGSESEPASAAADAHEGATALASEETITLWRPVRRTRPPRVPHRQRARTEAPASQATTPQPGSEVARSESPVPDREQRREKHRWRPPAAEQENGARSSHGPAGSAEPRPNESRRQSRENRGAPRPKAGSARQPQAVAVDPNSPFAKLLELRTLLESRGKDPR